MTARTKAQAEPILSARGIVNRFGKQVVHDKLGLDIMRRRDHRHRRRLGIRQVGPAEDARRPAPAGCRRSAPQRQGGSGIGAAERAALIGVLFQQGALFSSLSVAQNIMLPMREHTALPAAEREEIAAMKLALAGMPADSGVKFPSALSGGMVKRAAFARALALDPKILFLDEPTSDLDPIAASGIDALIRQLNDSLGMTVVIVTHDLTTLFTICGRIAVLVDRKVTIGTADKLMRSDHPWIHEFFHGPRAEGAMKARKTGHGN